MERDKLIQEWKKQIIRCDETIERYKSNGFYDLIPPIEELKKQAETELSKVLPNG